MEPHSAPGATGQSPTLTRQQLLELQLDDVQRVAHVGIWELQPGSGKLVWSDETFRIIGVDRTCFDSGLDTYLSVVHPEDRDKVRALLDQARHAPFQPVLEHRVIRPDGEIRHVFVRGYPFRHADGSLAVSGTVQDITEMKHSSEALQAKSLQLLSTLESMAEAFYTLDKDWRFTYLNHEAERMLQHPREALLGKVVWDAFGDLRGTRFESEFRQAMATGRPASFEALYVPFNSWKELRLFPSAEGLAVYFTDISERKRLEEVERENAERFRVVAMATTDIIWDWDPRVDRLWWNEGIESAFGYSPEEFNEGINAWSSRIHPDERERVAEGLYRAVETLQEHWRDEYRFQRKDGSWAQVRDHGILVRDDGKVLRVIGSVVDVTAQKQAELDQLQAEARYRLQASLLDKAHDAISVSDVDGRITYWNRGAQRLFGWTVDEAMGKTRAELLIVSVQEFLDAQDTVVRQGDWTGELRKWRKDGRSVTVECHMTLVRDDDGRPQAVLAI
ncbi:MAG: hypothetical protein JWQ80_1338, partial [Massilia sp.]|nr:hypothetical protein [Massilia sp.]